VLKKKKKKKKRICLPTYPYPKVMGQVKLKYKDGLINFLEAKTKKDVVMVDFGDEDSKKAIVTFDQSIGLFVLRNI
jgi:hypothetical protein